MLGKAVKQPIIKPAPLKYAGIQSTSTAQMTKMALLLVGGALAFYFINKIVLNSGDSKGDA